ncbi:MAG: NAD(P)/FAD-dependent oxidoreductase [Gilvibacter sp.]
MASTSYDIAIIGSGIGSLACASFLSHIYDKKVLVIEQHVQPGGLSQSFHNQDNVPFEIGIHQVGELEPTTMFSKLMTLMTQGNSEWDRLPEAFIKFHFPDGIYTVHAGQEKQIEVLTKHFPLEQQAIEDYYQDVAKITQWYRNYTLSSLDNNKTQRQEFLDSEVGKMAMLTTEDYLEQRFKDPKLISFIGSHWTDYGLPPETSAFLKHALLVNNHKEGVYYPSKGSTQMIDSIVDGIQSKGGQVLCNTRVVGVNHDEQNVQSLQVLNKGTGEQSLVYADQFVSGIGAYNTYARLLDEGISAPYLESLKSLKKHGVSFVKLFATLQDNPEKIGADKSLSWVYDSHDHNALYRDKNKLANGEISQYSISFPSLKKEVDAKHSMKINALIDYSVFESWGNANRTDEAYNELKQRIGNTLLNDVERLYPGLRELVSTWDVLTPISTKIIAGQFKGNIFGLPDTPERFKNLDFNCYTPLDNFYLTGSDITTSGIYAAVLSGVLTTQAICKDKQFFLKVITAAKRLTQNKESIAV